MTAWLNTWIEAHAVSLKPSTAKSYRDNIDRYLNPRIGHERLQALSPSRLSLMFRDLYHAGGKDNAPLSPRTVEFARAVLRKALDDAVLDRLLEVNPVVGTKRPKTVKPHHTVWTGPQLRTFLQARHHAGDRLTPLWTLAAGTGMRRGELLALRWADIDLDAGTIAVERSVTQIRRELHYTRPKNHERRDIPIDSQTADALRAWRDTQATERLAWSEAYEDNGLVFTRENGAQLPPNSVSRGFVQAQAGLGLHAPDSPRGPAQSRHAPPR